MILLATWIVSCSPPLPPPISSLTPLHSSPDLPAGFACCLLLRTSHACEVGVDQPELESTLWATTTSVVDALKHAAAAADYQTLCEGLARLHRIVGCLLRAAANASPAQHDNSEEADQSAAALAEVLRFCSRLVGKEGGICTCLWCLSEVVMCALSSFLFFRPFHYQTCLGFTSQTEENCTYDIITGTGSRRFSDRLFPVQTVNNAARTL